MITVGILSILSFQASISSHCRRAWDTYFGSCSDWPHPCRILAKNQRRDGVSQDLTLQVKG